MEMLGRIRRMHLPNDTFAFKPINQEIDVLIHLNSWLVRRTFAYRITAMLL